jgi:molybdenum ABC transporter molybdate-binding protein
MKRLLARSRALSIAIAFSLAAPAAAAPPPPPPLHVYAAGSLAGALADIARQYTAQSGQPVSIVTGPAGLLRQRIERGENADVFLSANTDYPRQFAEAGKGTPARVFARNSLCVLTRPDLGLSRENLLDKLLQPAVKIGTSTPGADPSGDYAWRWFAEAGARHPGAQRILEAKAQKLAGGPTPAQVPAGVNPVKYFLEQKTVDVFFGYCSANSTKPDPDLVKVAMPAELPLTVDFGMTVMLHPGDAQRQRASQRFADFLMGPAAQQRLARYGFVPVAGNP